MQNYLLSRSIPYFFHLYCIYFKSLFNKYKNRKQVNIFIEFQWNLFSRF
jgi:hypothetical protein